MSPTTTRPTLTDRYVDAVTRTVPERQRDDVAAELRTSIADQVEARTDAGEDPAAAERAVLTDLGDPDALAAGYADRPLQLIGPRYYLMWWRLLRLLLAIVLPFAAFGIALGQALSDAPLGTIIGSTVGGTLTTAVHVAFWTTLVFVVLDRTTTPADLGTAPWDVEQLPEPRPRGAGFGDLVAAVVMAVLVAGVVVWDFRLGLAWVDGTRVGVLHPDLWPWWAAGLIALLALEVAVALAVHLRRGWNHGLATANAVLALTVALSTVWLLTQDRLLNPDLLGRLTALGAEDLFTVVPVVTGFVVVGIAVWDAVDGFLKARRSRPAGPAPSSR